MMLQKEDPLSWTLQGPNNGSSWSTIDSRPSENFANRFQTREFTFSNSNSYSYYRFNLNNNSGTVLQFAEMELFGVAGGSSSGGSSSGGSSSGGSSSGGSDEFDSINSANWTLETGGGGWSNNELQYYTHGQNASIQFDSSVNSNALAIEARQEGGFNCWYGTCTHTSTRMVSAGKREFTYGRIEARMKLPQTQGIWPAFWMMGNNIGSVGWPTNGEIDIMEHVGFEPNVTHGALHGPGYSGSTPINDLHNFGQSVSNNYHVYVVEWDSNGIRWYVDSINFYSATCSQVEAYGNWVFDHPFFIFLNLAVGGGW